MPSKILVASLCALAGASACAIDFEGYVRAGTGDADETRRTCYDLAISGGHYRLGNECDFYAELGVSHTVVAGGVSMRGLAMVNAQHPGSDGAGTDAGLEQLYVEARGFVFAPTLGLWLGRRFHGRAGVHILDTWFVRLDGEGFGADTIVWGPARLGVSFFRSEAGSGAPPGAVPSERPAHRFNLDVTDIRLADLGTLRATIALTRGHDEPDRSARGTRGVGLSLQHDLQWPALGGSHIAWLQFAQGSAGLDGNFGSMTTDPDVTQWRVVESVTWQSGALGGQAVALYGRQGADAAHGVATRYAELSLGGRISYAVTPHLKLVAELGAMEKRPDGSDRQRLGKFTLAPTWSTGPAFRDRPELRFYVTWARWNDAANAASGARGLTGLGDGATRGTSWGVQLESWF